MTDHQLILIIACGMGAGEALESKKPMLSEKGYNYEREKQLKLCMAHARKILSRTGVPPSDS